MTQPPQQFKIPQEPMPADKWPKLERTPSWADNLWNWAAGRSTPSVSREGSAHGGISFKASREGSGHGGKLFKGSDISREGSGHGGGLFRSNSVTDMMNWALGRESPQFQSPAQSRDPSSHKGNMFAIITATSSVRSCHSVTSDFRTLTFLPAVYSITLSGSRYAATLN